MLVKRNTCNIQQALRDMIDVIVEAPKPDAVPADFEGLLAAERARIVRLCARLSGDGDAAEDLAQETLAEAWKQRRKLVEPAGAPRWLNAIARNVCLRWARSRGAEPPQGEPAAVEFAIDPAGLDVELERDELAALLDRALALLSPETRDVLIQKYVDESPLAAIAERLGLSPNAVAVRLHRGKLAFRRVLTTDLRHEAFAFGLVGDPTLAWQPTAMWCPICGGQRLQAAYDDEYRLFAVRCPACPAASGQAARFYSSQLAEPLKGRYRSALLRGLAEADARYREAQRLHSARCPECGEQVPLRFTLPPDCPGPFGDRRGMTLECARCDGGASISLRMFAQSQPQVRAFWKRNPRMHTLPAREVECDGVPAVVVRFESLGVPASIDVLVRHETWEVIEVRTAEAETRAEEVPSS